LIYTNIFLSLFWENVSPYQIERDKK
jgi:hypothetical protein